MTARDDLLDILSDVNATDTLGVTAKLDMLDSDAPAATVQQLPGARWTTRYMDGSGTREMPFAVQVRTTSTDSSTRADASATLYALADALEAIGDYEGTDTPSLVQRAENGTEVWRATFLKVLHLTA